MGHPQKQVEGLDHRQRAEAQLLQAPGHRQRIAPLGRVEQFQRVILGQHRHPPQLVVRIAAKQLDHHWVWFSHSLFAPFAARRGASEPGFSRGGGALRPSLERSGSEPWDEPAQSAADRQSFLSERAQVSRSGANCCFILTAATQS
jgi:hypothetical protein